MATYDCTKPSRRAEPWRRQSKLAVRLGQPMAGGTAFHGLNSILTGIADGRYGGMSRHRGVDPSNDRDGSTAAVRREFADRLLLIADHDREGRIIGLQRTRLRWARTDAIDERITARRPFVSGTAIPMLIALTSVEQFQSVGHHVLYRLVHFAKEFIWDYVVRLRATSAASKRYSPISPRTRRPAARRSNGRLRER